MKGGSQGYPVFLEIGMEFAAVKMSRIELRKSVESQGSKIVSTIARAILSEGEGAQHLSRPAGGNGCPHYYAAASNAIVIDYTRSLSISMPSAVVTYWCPQATFAEGVDSMWKVFRLAVHCHSYKHLDKPSRDTRLHSS